LYRGAEAHGEEEARAVRERERGRGYQVAEEMTPRQRVSGEEAIEIFWGISQDSNIQYAEMGSGHLGQTGPYLTK
jgi:hypothetical protein